MKASTVIILMICLISALPAFAGWETTTPPAAAGGSLKLTLQAEKTVLFAQPNNLRRATENSPRYQVESTPLTLTFTNTGDKPVKLNAYDLPYSRIRFHVSGPDANSVIVAERLVEREMAPPIEKNYQMLLPGGTHSVSAGMQFPESLGFTSYYLQRPGTYRVYATYENVAVHGHEMNENLPFATGCWLGAISSNVLTFTVLEAGEPVNGAQMALEATPSPKPGNNGVMVAAYVKNVSDKPLAVPAWDLYEQGLQVLGPDGQPIHYDGGADRSREPRSEELYAVVQPGATQAFPLLSGNYYPQKAAEDVPVATFNVMNKTGFFRNWEVKGPSNVLQASLTANGELNLLPKDAAVTQWQGKITSAPITVNWDLTTHRTILLKQDVKTLELALSYNGEQDKPFYTFNVLVSPTIRKSPNAFELTAILSEEESGAYIDSLAKAGILRDVQSLKPQRESLPLPIGYFLSITGGPNRNAAWELPLGWEYGMIERLEAIKTALPEKSRASMELLFGRLSGLRAQWEGAEALKHRVSLTVKDQSLIQAATAITQAAGSKSVQVQMDEWMQKDPAPALKIIDVPAAEALKAFAASADVSLTIKENVVIIRPWLQ